MTPHEALSKVESEDLDLYAYAGPIEKAGYESVCQAIEKNKVRRKKATLFLCTGGGSPNAGYRIARAFIHHYGSDNFTVAVPAECKSAGTLISIGAHCITLFDKGELGPLDVQFQKKDEIFEQSSGLDILRGMTYLKDDALASFNKYLIDINAASGLSTKVASEIAGGLVRGIYEPMYAQIDPVRLGEMNAALQIAHEYGTRLNEKSKNLKNNALAKLINDYPTHGFVIDRAEARTLFERVKSPSEIESFFGDFVSKVMWREGRQSDSYVVDLVAFFSTVFKKDASNAPPAASDAGQPPAAPSEPSDASGVSGSAPQIDGAEQPPLAGEPGAE